MTIGRSSGIRPAQNTRTLPPGWLPPQRGKSAYETISDLDHYQDEDDTGHMEPAYEEIPSTLGAYAPGHLRLISPYDTVENMPASAATGASARGVTAKPWSSLYEQYPNTFAEA